MSVSPFHAPLFSAIQLQKKLGKEAREEKQVSTKKPILTWESDDVLQEAKQTIIEVMRGQGGRNATARLTAAKSILDKNFLSQLSDEALLAEVKRRNQGREGK